MALKLLCCMCRCLNSGEIIAMQVLALMPWEFDVVSRICGPSFFTKRKLLNQSVTHRSEFLAVGECIGTCCTLESVTG